MGNQKKIVFFSVLLSSNVLFIPNSGLTKDKGRVSGDFFLCKKISDAKINCKDGFVYEKVNDIKLIKQLRKELEFSNNAIDQAQRKYSKFIEASKKDSLESSSLDKSSDTISSPIKYALGIDSGRVKDPFPEYLIKIVQDGKERDKFFKNPKKELQARRMPSSEQDIKAAKALAAHLTDRIEGKHTFIEHYAKQVTSEKTSHHQKHSFDASRYKATNKTKTEHGVKQSFYGAKIDDFYGEKWDFPSKDFHGAFDPYGYGDPKGAFDRFEEMGKGGKDIGRDPSSQGSDKEINELVRNELFWLYYPGQPLITIELLEKINRKINLRD